MYIRKNKHKLCKFYLIGILSFIFYVGLISSLNPPPVDNDMILYLQFNNASPEDYTTGAGENVVYDNSTALNNGTTKNNVTYNVTGGFLGDGAFEFDGANDQVNITIRSNSSEGFTYAFWVRTSNHSSRQRFLVSEEPSYSITQYINENTLSGLWFITNDSGIYGLGTSFSLISFDTWHFMVFTVNDTTSMWYRNGEFQNSKKQSRFNNISSNLRVGSGDAMKGSVDDVMVWNRTLSDTEIIRIYFDYICKNLSLQNDNLLLHYDFNQTNEGKVCDISGNKNYGTIVNNANISTFGFQGNSSYYFGTSFYNLTAGARQGTTGYIDILNSESLWFTPSDNFTINLFFNSLGNPIDTGKMGIFGREFRLAFQNTYTYTYFGIRNSTSDVTYKSTPYSHNVWNMLTGTYDSSTDKMAFYKDGVFVDDSEVIDNFDANSLSFKLGQFIFSGDHRSFNGHIDELKIWNKTLTKNTIWELFQNSSNFNVFPKIANITVTLNDTRNLTTHTTKDINYSSLEMWLDFDYNLTSFYDKSKNLNSVTGLGSANWIKTGKIGGGMSFNVSEDGANYSYALVNHNENISFNSTDDITISFWAYPVSYEFCGGAGGVVTKEASLGYQLSIRCSSSTGGFKIALWNGSYNPGLNPIVVPVGKWNHYTSTLKRYPPNISEIRTYLNGVQVAYSNITISGNMNNTGDWKIGSRVVALQRHYNGYLDEIMVFRKELNSSEVANLYSTSSASTLYHNNNITINASFIDDEDVELYYRWYINDVLDSEGINQTIYEGYLNNAESIIKVIVNDSDNNEGEFYFILEQDINPKVNIVTIQDRDYYLDRNLTFNYTIEEEYLDSCWYSVDGGATNTTLSGCSNFTYNFTTNGIKTIHIYVNDSYQGFKDEVIDIMIYSNDTICDSNYYDGIVNVTYNHCRLTMFNKFYANFNGIDTFINLGNDSKFLSPPDDEFYFSYWIKPDSLNTTKQNPFVKFGGSPNEGFGAYIDNRGSNNSVFYYFDQNGIERGAGRSWVMNQEGDWYQTIAVKSGTSLSLYVDGKSVYSRTSGGNLTFADSREFIFGRSGGGSARFNGSIADFKIYKGRLSNFEVKDLYSKYYNNLNEYDIPVFMLHQYDEDNEAPTGSLELRPDELDTFLDFMNNSGYQTISLYQYYQYRIGNYTLPTHPFVMTFDDTSYNDWLLMAHNMSLYNYTGVAALTTKGCGSTCWSAINNLIINYSWDMASHSSTHCHHGNGVGGTTPVWCNTTEERRGNMSGSRQDIIDNTGVTPTAMIFPWNDWGVGAENQDEVMDDCEDFYNLCFSNALRLPSAYFINENSGFFNGDLKRTALTTNFTIDQLNLGLNYTITNYRNNLNILNMQFDYSSGGLVFDGSLNNHNGTLGNTTLGKDDFYGFYNDNSLNPETINLTGLTNSLIYDDNGTIYNQLTNINNNDGDINITIHPNNTIYILDNFNLTEGITRTNSPLAFSSISETISTRSFSITSTITDEITVPTILDTSTVCRGVQTIVITPNGETPYNADYTCNDGIITITNANYTKSSTSNSIVITFSTACDLMVTTVATWIPLIGLLGVVIFLGAAIGLILIFGLPKEINRTFLITSVLILIAVAVLVIISIVILNSLCSAL